MGKLVGAMLDGVSEGGVEGKSVDCSDGDNVREAVVKLVGDDVGDSVGVIRGIKVGYLVGNRGNSTVGDEVG
jgi:hypothetical protein